MLNGLEARAARAGDAAAADAAARIAAEIGAALPGAAVSQEGGRVTIAGRRLRDHPALRWIGGYGR
jgi:hypothetical protein